MSLIITINDTNGKFVCSGIVHSVTMDSNDAITYVLSRVHRPCVMEEGLCRCDAPPV